MIFLFCFWKNHRGNRRQPGHSVGFFFFYFPVNTNLYVFKRGSTGISSCKIFKFQNSAKHCCIDKSATATFRFYTLFFYLFHFFCFAFPLSPFSSSIVTAVQKEYEIFIRASCVERHNFYMVMLLASQITLCSSEQNNPSLGSLPFLVFPRNAVA